MREDARDLPNISKIVEQFKKQSKITLGQIPGAHAHIRNVHKLADELNYGQIVSEKLASLAHSAIDLKIAAATGDHKKAQRLLGAFLSDPHTNIKRLCGEVPHFESHAEELNKTFAKLAKRDKVLFEALTKKVQEIREHPRHYKPLRAPLQNKRRVHVGGLFVLIFSIDDARNRVRLLEFEHHDNAYK